MNRNLDEREINKRQSLCRSVGSDDFIGLLEVVDCQFWLGIYSVEEVVVLSQLGLFSGQTHFWNVSHFWASFAIPLLFQIVCAWVYSLAEFLLCGGDSSETFDPLQNWGQGNFGVGVGFWGLGFFEDGFEFIGEVFEFVEVEFVFGEEDLIFFGWIGGGIFEWLELVFE